MSGYLNSYQSTIDRVRPVIPETTDKTLPSTNREQAAALKNLGSGETIQGEIISVKGNEVLVKLSDQTVISARLTGDLQVLVGQNLMFEVQNGTEGQVALRALFANLAGGELLANALSDAGIPMNGETAEMVEYLMKEELPIGKEHLQKVYRDVLEFRELKPAEIVKMHKLGIEVNEYNVKQFSAFINCEERIANDTTKLIASLKDEIRTLQFLGEQDQAFELEKQILALLSEPSESVQTEGQNIISFSKTEVLNVLQNLISDESLNFSDIINGTDNISEEVKELLKEVISQISTGESNEVSAQKFFALLTQKAEAGYLPKEVLNKLFENNEFSEMISKALEEQWLLKPADVENGKNITDFYQRLQQHVMTLSATVTEAISASQSLTQSLTQMRENVDFLNQLSQMIPYVQLPLKLNGQSATGDLYVFADKKSLAEKGENITAVLHLDMQYLGHLDVFVKLVSSKVETDFKVENDATLQFLSDHIEILNERLQKRGYDLKINLDKMKEPSNIKKDLIEGPESEEIETQPIAYYRLDVRA